MKLEEAVVLVVDDEPDLRSIFGGWLGRKGCRVVTAANGAEALDVLTTQKIDVLVSDIRMPVLDGVGLVRRMNEQDIFVPSIVFVSGFGDVEPREMYALGVERLIEKPLCRSDLIRALEDSVKEREELWLTPPDAPMQLPIALAVDSIGDSPRDFQLGRGGCCFATDTDLRENQTVDLTVHFAAESLTLRAAGVVRWYDEECACAGMAFEYLAPPCRDWVVQAMKCSRVHSFIPGCPAVGRKAEERSYIAAGASMPR